MASAKLLAQAGDPILEPSTQDRIELNPTAHANTGTKTFRCWSAFTGWWGSGKEAEPST
jgi:hypothetical protein